jgi:hypothetical protein
MSLDTQEIEGLLRICGRNNLGCKLTLPQNCLPVVLIVSGPPLAVIG